MELRECLLLKTVTATLNEQSWTYCFDASRKGDINNVFSLPRYSFTVLEDSGWNFRHAYYHEMNRRTLLKVLRNNGLTQGYCDLNAYWITRTSFHVRTKLKILH